MLARLWIPFSLIDGRTLVPSESRSGDPEGIYARYGLPVNARSSGGPLVLRNQYASEAVPGIAAKIGAYPPAMGSRVTVWLGNVEQT